jgi:hypothetical protein
VILKLVGGTCGAAMIFLMPGAMLVQHARSLRVGQRRWQQQQQQQHQGSQPLAEPLLQPGASTANQTSSVLDLHSAEAEERQRGRALCCSGTFWAGIALLLLGFALAALTVATTLHPLRPT